MNKINTLFIETPTSHLAPHLKNFDSHNFYFIDFYENIDLDTLFNDYNLSSSTDISKHLGILSAPQPHLQIIILKNLNFISYPSIIKFSNLLISKNLNLLATFDSEHTPDYSKKLLLIRKHFKIELCQDLNIPSLLLNTPCLTPNLQTFFSELIEKIQTKNIPFFNEKLQRTLRMFSTISPEIPKKIQISKKVKGVYIPGVLRKKIGSLIHINFFADKPTDFTDINEILFSYKVKFNNISDFSDLNLLTNTTDSNNFTYTTLNLYYLNILSLSVLSNVNVILKGPQGAGKTCLVQQLANINNKKLFVFSLNASTEPEHVFLKSHFSSINNNNKTNNKNEFHILKENSLISNAFHNFDWILLDEANLCSKEILQGLISLFPTKRFFLTMNPPSNNKKNNKKEIDPTVGKTFLMLFVSDYDQYNDLLLIVNNYIIKLKLTNNMNVIKQLLNWYLELKELQLVFVNTRTLLRAFQIAIDHFENLNINNFNSIYYGFKICFIYQLNNNYKESINKLNHILKPFIEKEGSFLSSSLSITHSTTNNTLANNNSKIITTSSFKKHLNRVLKTLSLSSLPILLTGPTSAGKTTLITHLSNILSHPLTRVNNHPHMDSADYFGSYTYTDNSFTYKESSFIAGVRQGHFILLDEINLCPSDVLEALNRLLDDNKELIDPFTGKVIKPGKGFRLFGTLNPSNKTYRGRSELSEAFKSRFIGIEIEGYQNKEMFEILIGNFKIAESFVSKMIIVKDEINMVKCSEFNAVLGEENTMRDLFRWAKRCPETWEELMTSGYEVLGSKLRNKNDQSRLLNILNNNCKINNFTHLTSSSESFLDFLLHKKIKSNSSLNNELISLAKLNNLILSKETQYLALLILESLMLKENVLLVGPTSTGKTSLIILVSKLLKQSLSTINCSADTDSADLIGNLTPTLSNCSKPFSWRDGLAVTAAKEGSLLLIDEINLADSGTIERINSLLDVPPSLTLTENVEVTVTEGVDIHEDFRIFATMNPGGDYGKKELSLALRNRFREIFVGDINDCFIMEKIISNNFSQGENDFMLPKLQKYFNSPDSLITLRNLKYFCNFIQFLNNTNIVKLYLDEIILFFFTSSPTFSIEFQNILNKIFNFNLLPSITPLNNENNIIYSFEGPSVRSNIIKFAIALNSSSSILIEGPPATGKSSLVSHYSQFLNKKLFRINLSENVDFSDLIGRRVPSTKANSHSLSFEWQDGPLLKALKQDTWILLDELNLADNNILEGLNSLLDDRKSLFVPDLNESFKIQNNFKIIATQNAHSLTAGRKGLPKSFRNRFVSTQFEIPTTEDLYLIFNSKNKNEIDNAIEAGKESRDYSVGIRDYITYFENNQNNLFFSERNSVNNSNKNKFEEFNLVNFKIERFPLSYYIQRYFYYLNTFLATKKPLLIKTNSIFFSTKLINLFLLYKGINSETIKCTSEMDTYDLIGHYDISLNPNNNSKFYWEDGILTTALKNNKILICEEIDLLDKGVTDRFNDLLEKDGSLTIYEHLNEEIEKSKTFNVIFITDKENPSNSLSDAMRSRCLEINFNFCEDEILSLITAMFELEILLNNLEDQKSTELIKIFSSNVNNLQNEVKCKLDMLTEMYYDYTHGKVNNFNNTNNNLNNFNLSNLSGDFQENIQKSLILNFKNDYENVLDLILSTEKQDTFKDEKALRLNFYNNKLINNNINILFKFFSLMSLVDLKPIEDINSLDVFINLLTSIGTHSSFKSVYDEISNLIYNINQIDQCVLYYSQNQIFIFKEFSETLKSFFSSKNNINNNFTNQNISIKYSLVTMRNKFASNLLNIFSIFLKLNREKVQELFEEIFNNSENIIINLNIDSNNLNSLNKYLDKELYLRELITSSHYFGKDLISDFSKNIILMRKYFTMKIIKIEKILSSFIYVKTNFKFLLNIFTISTLPQPSLNNNNKNILQIPFAIDSKNLSTSKKLLQLENFYKSSISTSKNSIINPEYFPFNISYTCRIISYLLSGQSNKFSNILFSQFLHQKIVSSNNSNNKHLSYLNIININSNKLIIEKYSKLTLIKISCLKINFKNLLIPLQHKFENNSTGIISLSETLTNLFENFNNFSSNQIKLFIKSFFGILNQILDELTKQLKTLVLISKENQNNYFQSNFNVNINNIENLNSFNISIFSFILEKRILENKNKINNYYSILLIHNDFFNFLKEKQIYFLKELISNINNKFKIFKITVNTKVKNKEIFNFEIFIDSINKSIEIFKANCKNMSFTQYTNQLNSTDNSSLIESYFNDFTKNFSSLNISETISENDMNLNTIDINFFLKHETTTFNNLSICNASHQNISYNNFLFINNFKILITSGLLNSENKTNIVKKIFSIFSEQFNFDSEVINLKSKINKFIEENDILASYYSKVNSYLNIHPNLFIPIDQDLFIQTFLNINNFTNFSINNKIKNIFINLINNFLIFLNYQRIKNNNKFSLFNINEIQSLISLITNKHFIFSKYFNNFIYVIKTSITSILNINTPNYEERKLIKIIQNKIKIIHSLISPTNTINNKNNKINYFSQLITTQSEIIIIQQKYKNSLLFLHALLTEKIKEERSENENENENKEKEEKEGTGEGLGEGEGKEDVSRKETEIEKDQYNDHLDKEEKEDKEENEKEEKEEGVEQEALEDGDSYEGEEEEEGEEEVEEGEKGEKEEKEGRDEEYVEEGGEGGEGEEINKIEEEFNEMSEEELSEEEMSEESGDVMSDDESSVFSVFSEGEDGGEGTEGYEESSEDMEEIMDDIEKEKNECVWRSMREEKTELKEAETFNCDNPDTNEDNNDNNNLENNCDNNLEDINNNSEENNNNNLEKENNNNNNIIENNNKLEIQTSNIPLPTLSQSNSLLNRTISQLTAALEKTTCNRLIGYYRTGKKLNIKRYIDFIASNGLRDRLWLRRRKMPKLNYKINLFIDNSQSMAENNASFGAVESALLLNNSFEQISEIAKSLSFNFSFELFSFGESIEKLSFSSFNNKNSSSSNEIDINNIISFNGSNTNWTELTEKIETLEDNDFSTAEKRIYVIISDGRINCDRETLRGKLEEMEKEDNLVVLVIIDGEEKVEEMKSVRMDGDEVVVEKYLENFPFKHYSVVNDGKMLAGKVARMIEVWLEENM